MFKKIIFFILVFIFILFILLEYFYIKGYRFNSSSSMPIGIYKIDKSSSYNRGDLVFFCLPEKYSRYAHDRGYVIGNTCPNHTSFLVKKILAVPNDNIVVNSKGITVNGIFYNYPQKFKDSSGRKLDTFTFSGKLNGYFLIGTYSDNSWDSRYFGVIDEKYIQGKLHKVYTF